MNYLLIAKMTKQVLDAIALGLKSAKYLTDFEVILHDLEHFSKEEEDGLCKEINYKLTRLYGGSYVIDFTWRGDKSAVLISRKTAFKLTVHGNVLKLADEIVNDVVAEFKSRAGHFPSHIPYEFAKEGLPTVADRRDLLIDLIEHGLSQHFKYNYINITHQLFIPTFNIKVFVDGPLNEPTEITEPNTVDAALKNQLNKELLFTAQVLIESVIEHEETKVSSVYSAEVHSGVDVERLMDLARIGLQQYFDDVDISLASDGSGKLNVAVGDERLEEPVKDVRELERKLHASLFSSLHQAVRLRPHVTTHTIHDERLNELDSSRLSYVMKLMTESLRTHGYPNFDLTSGHTSKGRALTVNFIDTYIGTATPAVESKSLIWGKAKENHKLTENVKAMLTAMQLHERIGSLQLSENDIVAVGHSPKGSLLYLINGITLYRVIVESDNVTLNTVAIDSRLPKVVTLEDMRLANKQPMVDWVKTLTLKEAYNLTR